MMLLYNSLVKNKVEFVPIEDGKVKLYTCGPTVYDYSHVGNFRTFLFEDLLKRVLIAFGFKVKHVMNITDVDDKTISKSTQQQIELKDLTQRYTNEFMKDIDFLRILRADEYPNATDHVDEMILMIQTLIDKEHAYISEDGSVFFKIDSCSDYGVLVNIEKSENSHRYEISDEYSSDNANDFALWKSYKKDDGKIYWDSPWGKGRPGWHIECSAMATKYLGDHFDIHCGGVDNKFPHHENEIAQSTCALETPFVNYWLHSEFLMVEGSKMSKSLNNFYTISDIYDNGFTPEEFRFLILSAHYRSRVNFSLNRRKEAKSAIKRITETQDRLSIISTEESSEYPSEYINFNERLADDLDAPGALAVFFDWIRNINILIDSKEISIVDAQKGNSFISYFDSIFAIVPQKDVAPQELVSLVEKREESRKNRDWANSDRIRVEIEKKGWLIKDTVNGPKLVKK
ncbi:MAG: cysteine--tRNA ligase [Candidatus Neomarinimicrobiota bacterium]|nr:cysteine--tRNA ligase [Candidatus Neomarinimicrobiota bacterium]MEC8689264.1 cysteine--tRNA ligase [Candidatus Neomarinimicrobiota bacterium]